MLSLIAIATTEKNVNVCSMFSVFSYANLFPRLTKIYTTRCEKFHDGFSPAIADSKCFSCRDSTIDIALGDVDCDLFAVVSNCGSQLSSAGIV